MSGVDAVQKLRNAAAALRLLPKKMGEFYANGGPGVAIPVVGDRYGGAQNSRFAPLSSEYAAWKSGKAKGLNEKQHETYGRRSKLIKVEHKRRTQGVDIHGFSKNLPILVLTGKLRAAVALRRDHKVDSNGDNAYITFAHLPDYAKHHETGTDHMPRRSPVDPNEHDLERVREFAMRWLTLQTGRGSSATAIFGSGQARVI